MRCPQLLVASPEGVSSTHFSSNLLHYVCTVFGAQLSSLAMPQVLIPSVASSNILALSTSRWADVNVLAVNSSSFPAFCESTILDSSAMHGNTHPHALPPGRAWTYCFKNLRLEYYAPKYLILFVSARWERSTVSQLFIYSSKSHSPASN